MTDNNLKAFLESLAESIDGSGSVSIVFAGKRQKPINPDDYVLNGALLDLLEEGGDVALAAVGGLVTEVGTLALLASDKTFSTEELANHLARLNDVVNDVGEAYNLNVDEGYTALIDAPFSREKKYGGSIFSDVTTLAVCLCQNLCVLTSCKTKNIDYPIFVGREKMELDSTFSALHLAIYAAFIEINEVQLYQRYNRADKQERSSEQ